MREASVDRGEQKPRGRPGASAAEPGLVREIGRGIVVLGLTGSSFGGLLGVVAQAARALGR